MRRWRHMMRRSGAVVLAALACLGARAAPFDGVAEYFVDADPGPGNGVAVTVAGGIAAFTVATDDLEVGTHTLYLRAQAADGTWGLPVAYPFTRDLAVPTAPATGGVLEYFIGADPGAGAGVAVALAGGMAALTVDTAALAPGAHILYLRARAAGGPWGMRHAYPFTVDPSANGESIAAVAYRWDGGSWTTLPLGGAGGLAVSRAFAPDVAGLSFGTHLLQVRGVDSSGDPGIPHTQLVAVTPDGASGVSRLAACLERDGAVVAGSYTEVSLDGLTAPMARSLELPLAGAPAGGANVVAWTVSAAGQPGWAAFTPFMVVVEGTNNYASWGLASQYFSPAELADPAVGGPLADPDGDGLANAAEFALGTDPRADSQQQLPKARPAAGQLLFTFRQLQGGTGDRAYGYTAEGVSYRVEWCHDLAAGHWSPGGGDALTVASVTDNGDGTDTVELRVSRSLVAGHPATFLRLRLVLL